MRNHKSRICWSLISVGLLALVGFGLNTTSHSVHANVFDANHPSIVNQLHNQGDTKPNSKVSLNGLDGMNFNPDAGDLSGNELQDWVNSDAFGFNYPNILNQANQYNQNHKNNSNNQGNLVPPNPSMFDINNDNSNSNSGSNVNSNNNNNSNNENNNNDNNQSNTSNTNSLIGFSDDGTQVLNNYKSLINNGNNKSENSHQSNQTKSNQNQIKRNHRRFVNKNRRHVSSRKDASVLPSYRYLVPKRAIHLYTKARFGNRHSSAGYLTPRKSVKILRAYHFHHQLRYAVKVGKRTLYIIGNRNYVENAFYQRNIFKKFGKAPKVVAKRRCFMYSKLNGKKNHKRLVKAGRKLRIKRVVTLGRKSNKVTRFYLANGMYITANKSWVKVIK